MDVIVALDAESKDFAALISGIKIIYLLEGIVSLGELTN